MMGIVVRTRWGCGVCDGIGWVEGLRKFEVWDLSFDYVSLSFVLILFSRRYSEKEGHGGKMRRYRLRLLGGWYIG